MSKPVKIKKVWTRYLSRIGGGQRIMVDGNGNMSWSDGRSCSRNVVREMLDAKLLARLDADLFGDPNRGQTIGRGVAA